MSCLFIKSSFKFGIYSTIITYKIRLNDISISTDGTNVLAVHILFLNAEGPLPRGTARSLHKQCLLVTISEGACQKN